MIVWLFSFSNLVVGKGRDVSRKCHSRRFCCSVVSSNGHASLIGLTLVAVKIHFNLQQNEFVTKTLKPEVANSLEENMT